jgi:CxxC motif-containing protein (DUF1111 family)
MVFCIIVLSQCRKPDLFPEDGFDERLAGGINTVFDNTSGAFGHEFPYMGSYDLSTHELGDGGFEQTFVTAPAPVNQGLGPAFNNVSCKSCHHNDGIGTPTAGDIHSALLVRISFPGTGAHAGAIPVPGYGTQLQDKAVFGKMPECNIMITYTDKSYTFPDGESYTLHEPSYQLINLHEPISGSYLLSPRLAPSVFGLGLLEAIPEYSIRKLADEFDADGDGISGKVNEVWDPATGAVKMGRFGLKANTASILTQVAGAYNQDMGITSRVFPAESTFGQSQYDNLDDDKELPDSILNAVKFYVQTLAVPARRDVTDDVIVRGKNLFLNAGCNKCHIPVMYTGVNVAFPPLSNQRIQPFTDLLVHDMGDGLADNRPDFLADGKEWRTTPLWGLGLMEVVNAPPYYLHDGRARTLTEAIMWHGGESETSKNYYSQLSKTDRNALLKFLGSL